MSEPGLNPDQVSGAVADRIAGVVLLLMAAGAWWYSHSFPAGFGQVVGPGAFPRLVSVPMGLFAAYLVIRPGVNQRWPQRAALLRQAAALLLLGIYAGLLKPLGFLPASLVCVVLLIRLFGATWRASLACGVPLTIGLYLLFEFALGMPLPNMPGLDW
ncbi:tripartite tricarboxylate transporter TctB family protein [Billgrantia antri]|uniref:Tripartite tricarboxylate transporter TctB family protein n=1 Tax=Billgrantia antri TaxID=2846777 RepID=A0ABS6ZTN7_9GAMM|nr:tripartite tricarboxylate transporter TctB family protein [Halomonas antri]